MASTFQCDNCGREFPRSQLKEAFTGEGPDRTKDELCPECLDEWMKESDQVLGIPGDEKRAAAHLGESAERPPVHQTFGQRR